MTETISITLPDATHAWLKRESARAGQTPADFVAEILAGLADPGNVESDLLDRLLAEAVTWFPPLMTLDEQAEMREEILDYFCHRIQEQYASQLGRPMSHAEAEQFRDRLAERATDCWQQN